mmetsp:Transcript_20174/g.19128  ORF Transcript_20174/g.19128 Transcript_20174/m.19128 type:complete len:95 (+) Transcript_20174:658-942(+)|eukprot:CAMPEP_0170553256 /NCGR_PEP_ID=MMETSP0211-20121228/11060_1 /TAXON_ID=311385 /ORGANISM="Pseudokeronopsis sp., Strain OXSARD2" /LENGTH=94 /DNA_ID=CAMNT_0010861447 /DNA_START=650 /DNA_END=934 /DNA_ORIENTATION=-
MVNENEYEALKKSVYKRVNHSKYEKKRGDSIKEHKSMMKAKELEKNEVIMNRLKDIRSDIEHKHKNLERKYNENTQMTQHIKFSIQEFNIQKKE